MAKGTRSRLEGLLWGPCFLPLGHKPGACGGHMTPLWLCLAPQVLFYPKTAKNIYRGIFFPAILEAEIDKRTFISKKVEMSGSFPSGKGQLKPPTSPTLLSSWESSSPTPSSLQHHYHHLYLHLCFNLWTIPQICCWDHFLVLITYL